MEQDLPKRRALYVDRAAEADRLARVARGQAAKDIFRGIADSWRLLADQVSVARDRD